MNPTDTSSRADVGTRAALGRSLADALHRDIAVSVSAFDRVAAAVDASHHLLTPRAVTPREGIEVLEGGGRVRVGSGATVRQVNTRLARHGLDHHTGSTP